MENAVVMAAADVQQNPGGSEGLGGVRTEVPVQSPVQEELQALEAFEFIVDKARALRTVTEELQRAGAPNWDDVL